MNEYLNSGRSNQKLKTRNKILSSAQKLLNKETFFSLDEVAEVSGLSRATVYRYYSNVELLAAEAALNIYTHPPEKIYSDLKEQDLTEKILGIQRYFNQLAIDHEASFRKFLSIALSTTQDIPKRGARRTETVKLALEQHKTNWPPQVLQNFIYIATVLMGIEPLIVTKDVCQLDDKQSSDVLRWGLQMLIRGIMSDIPENK